MHKVDETVITKNGVNIRAIRQELGMSQAQLAQLVGFSVRAIQSVEQGWRNAGPALEKSALLLIMSHRRSGEMPRQHCWELTSCPPAQRDGCITYRTGQGHLCWFLSGTLCTKQLQTWEEKRAVCLDCHVFRTLMGGDGAVAESV